MQNPILPVELIITIFKLNHFKIKYLLINKYIFNLLIKQIWNKLILTKNDIKIFSIIINLTLSKYEINYLTNIIYQKPIINYLKFINNINYYTIIILTTKITKPEFINMIIPITNKIIKKIQKKKLQI